MKSTLLRIFAVAMSLTLVVGLIYFRAGGRLFAEPALEKDIEGLSDIEKFLSMHGTKSAPVFETTESTTPEVLEPDDENSSFSGGLNKQGFMPNLDFGTKWGTMIRREDIQKAISGKNGRQAQK